MLNRFWRLCRAAVGLTAAVAMTLTVSAQVTVHSDMEVRFIDGNGQPIPPDFVTIRNSEGNVIIPQSQTNNGFLFVQVGRKITFEFTPKGLKSRSIDLVLLDAPRVYVEMVVEPATGRIKELRQKPVPLNPQPGKKTLKWPDGQQNAVVPPPNDACATAIPVASGVHAFTTVDATTDGPAGACSGGSQIHNDVWYDWVSPGNGTVTVSTCNTCNYDSKIGIYSTAACPPAGLVGCNDDFAGCAGFSSTASAPVVSGNTYRIRIGGFGTTSRGSGTFSIGFAGPPANDECAGGILVPCNSTTALNNATATTNVTDPAYSCRFGGAGQGFGTMWYSFVATGSSALIDTNGSGVSDTMLALYTGNCGSLVEIGCDDDSGVGLLSLINAGGLTAGTTYTIQVSSFSAASQGNITLNISCASGPPPGDDCSDPIPVACGGSATFDNTTYTTDPLDPAYSCRFGGAGQGINTVWLTFTATHTSAFVDTNLSFAFDTMLALYDGTCGSFVELCCSDDDGLGLLSQFCCDGLTVGNTYYLQVSSFSVFDLGEITVSVTCPCPAPPENDECEDAIDLGALPASVILDNSLATDDIAVPCGVASGPFFNMWYSVAGTGNTLTATTCNAGTVAEDTKISIFCGDCLEPICVAGNDDSCGAFHVFNSTVSWCSQAGANYLITIGMFSPGNIPGVIQMDVTDGGVGCIADVVCLPQGACCLEDSSCVVTTSDDCAAQGGDYQGDGTECDANAIADGSFEAGPFSGNWVEFSTNFGTPICDPGSCGFGGGTGPRTGNFWSWFGGIPAFEEGSMSQAVAIPTNATTLDFFLEIPVASANGVDFLEVLIDGFQVHLILEGDGPFLGYVPVSVPLGAFADGGVHVIDFHSIMTGSGGTFTNFFVDDVSILTQVTECIQCVTVDFETDDNGGAIADGQKIDSEYFVDFTVAGSGLNNGSAAFDSTNPPFGQDPDLAVGQGMVLILQNDASPGLVGCCYPAPNDDEDGGSQTFSFTAAVELQSVDLIDIDLPAPDQDVSVVLTDGNGFTRTYTVPAGWTADGGVGTLDLTTLAPQPGVSSIATAGEQVGFDASNVVQLRVTFGSSGALDNLTYCK